MPEMNHLWLASSGMPFNIFSIFLLIMMTDGFMRRRTSQWHLRPQRLDDPVLVILQRMLYSEFPFVDQKNRQKMLSRFGMSFFLLSALMHPGGSFFLHAINRVKRGFLSPPQQIQSALSMLSNPFFQSPPFQLTFSIKGFEDWDGQVRLKVMMYLLGSLPQDFILWEFLVIVRHLMLTKNPLWKSLVNVYICNSLDHNKWVSDEDCCPSALLELSTVLAEYSKSEVYHDFARLFQPEESVPNDRDSFIAVIEFFLECMINNLSNFPGIFVESVMIHFSWRDHQLSQEGIALSREIMQKLRWVHSLIIPEGLMELLHDINFSDSDMSMVYRGFEFLLRFLQMIQESNSIIYTYIHAYILLQTSEEPENIAQFKAIRDLFKFVTFNVNNESPDSKVYTRYSSGVYSFLKQEEEDVDMPEEFLINCLLEPNFLITLEELLQCQNDSELESFAKVFMNNPDFVELFERYINENPCTWSRA